MKQKLLSILFVLTCFVGVSFAQNRQVSGKITSATDGSPISGATVLLKGTSTGTQTDVNGEFIIYAPEGATLIVRNIGHIEKLVSANSTVLNISLVSNEAALDEVVVVGYGSGTNLSTTVGSVARVSSKDIEGRPTANALEALQGKVPGLQVFTSSGEPSATQSVRLHGVGSLGASSTPLYVLDGVPVSPNSIVSMNPSDYESITVLKDASATSIYGARAANGVIYFTSKKGKRGEKATISLRSQMGWSNLATTKAQENFMNADELLNFWLETGYRTQAQVDKLREDYPNDTKWYKYYTKEDAPMQQHDLSISGGSDKTTYFLSSSYFDQEGLMYRSNFDRVTLRSNIDSRLNDWMRVGLNLSGGYDVRELNGWGANSTNGGIALLAPPFYTPFDENGNEYYDKQIPGWARWSPRYLADKNPADRKRKQFNPTGYVEVKPINGLSLKIQGGMDYTGDRYSYRRLPSYGSNLGNGEGGEESDEQLMRTIQNTVEYRFSVSEKHNLAFLAGHEYVDYTREIFSASSTGMTDDRLILLPAGPNNRNVGQSKVEYAFNSYFGRGSYNFDNKYFFDATIRQDASSRFGVNNQTATFWSLGGMWNAKSEEFLNDVEWVNDFKVRASIGTSGNSEIGNYNSLSTVGTSIYNGETAWGVGAPGNPSLSWESQRKLTIGFATTLFSKVNFDLEYYHRTTDNMLVSVPHPYTTGFSDITKNVGSLQNQGFDLSLSVDVLSGNDYFFTPYINLNYNKEKVTDLFQNKDYWIVPNTGVSWSVGQPVMYFYPIVAGVNPETGLQQWFVPGEDIAQTNKDPENVTSVFNASNLQQNTGIRRYPPFNGGFGFASGYKGFSVDAFFAFSQGKYLINNDRYFYENPYNFAGFNQSRDVLDYWKEPGDVARFPKYGQINQFDSGLIEDASFLRLKTLTISYQLPKRILDRSKFFTGARIFYTGRNLFTATKYLGPDPEVDSNLTLGVNPNTKQSMFGLEIQF
ncbi:SusC/RagA family TonB-linked outer membrane protein [Sphingobacterium bambusae]|uniref:SusC/RagA family TonB-linked outer membrane protein n=1 Tax=Sphingobacterium bambusae TaxID=662858 RepID=A0ABW6BG17_9SPHI|nr:SusC/RagA family TonB-linked outer membrane protein [Sphingobacterium bambusae]WPL47146.1 SusC/RagA family TonB-linked outer membrane protein [Sphingobacterium bambusae]